VPAVPPEHIQPVSPVRPARAVWRDRVCERALGGDEREGQGRSDERLRAVAAGRASARARAATCTRTVRWWRGAVRRGDFGDEREVEAVR